MTSITVYCYNFNFLTGIVVSLLLCLTYKLSFTTGTYVQEPSQYIWGSVLSVVSDIHWESWNVSCTGKWGTTVFKKMWTRLREVTQTGWQSVQAFTSQPWKGDLREWFLELHFGKRIQLLSSCGLARQHQVPNHSFPWNLRRVPSDWPNQPEARGQEMQGLPCTQKSASWV